MRISTGMIFDAGVNAMNRQTAALLKTQDQVSTGRRIVTPSDDPVAAARALELTQAKDITAQYTTNQSNADSALGLSDSTLSSVTDLLTRVRQLAVQAGNTTLSDSDRASIADELRSSFDQLIGLANTADGTGQYLFSGYMGDTKPFAGSVEGGVQYSGDDGQRLLQVSASRQMAVSDSGRDVFQNVRNGNGYFVTGYNAANTGGGIIDAGSITDPAAWNASNRNYQVRFWVDSSTATPTTYYDVIDTTDNLSLLTHAAPESPPAAFPGGLTVYHSGDSIPIPGAGAQVIINGTPANGDSFTLAPSSTQSVFTTLANLIGTLENAQTRTVAGTAALSNQIGFALTNIDQAAGNIDRVRSLVGARMNETDALRNTNSSLNLQYDQALSNLQDVDYTKAISDLTRQQTNLTAAQKAFAMVSQLSLFNYL